MKECTCKEGSRNSHCPQHGDDDALLAQDEIIRERQIQVEGLQAHNRKLESKIAVLESQLAMALDAAAKGDRARENAAGMEMRIKELEETIKVTLRSAKSNMPPSYWDAFVDDVKTGLGVDVLTPEETDHLKALIERLNNL